MPAAPPFDSAVANRWFGVEYNNAAWELVEKFPRSQAETEMMLHYAHAAFVHWRAVGTALNEQRAECLLATAYASAGRVDQAQYHAARTLDLMAANGEEQSPFDRASALGCAARVAELAGDHASAVEHYDQVLRVITAFDEPADRDLIGQLYPQPKVG